MEISRFSVSAQTAKMLVLVLLMPVMRPSESVANVVAGTEEIAMNPGDVYSVASVDGYTVEIVKYVPMRVAEVKVTPNDSPDFSLMLYFKCDTPELGQFDTPEKIAASVKASPEELLSEAAEKTAEIKPLSPNGRYGCYTVLTDSDLANEELIPAGEFKYIVRGMIRLSADAALGFSLLTNKIDTPEFQNILDYICSFAK